MRLLIIIGVCALLCYLGIAKLNTRFQEGVKPSRQKNTPIAQVKEQKEKNLVPFYFEFKNRKAPADLGTVDALTNVIKIEVEDKQIPMMREYFQKLDKEPARRSVQLQLFEVRREDGDTLKLSAALTAFKFRIEMTPLGLPFAFGEVNDFSAFLFHDHQKGRARLMLDTQVSLCSGESLTFKDIGQQQIASVTTTETATTQSSTFQDIGLTFTLKPVALANSFVVGYEWTNSEVQTATTKTETSLTGSVVLDQSPVVLLSSIREVSQDKSNRFLFIPTGITKSKIASQAVLIITPIESPDDRGHVAEVRKAEPVAPLLQNQPPTKAGADLSEKQNDSLPPADGMTGPAFRPGMSKASGGGDTPRDETATTLAPTISTEGSFLDRKISPVNSGNVKTQNAPAQDENQKGPNQTKETKQNES